MKFTKKQITVFIGLCFIGIVLTFLIIFNLLNKEDQPDTPKEVEKSIGKIPEESHEDEPFEKDPFQNKGIKDVSLHGYVFSKPEEVTGAFIANANPTIIDISKKHILLQTSTNSLYVYNTSDNTTNHIANRVRKATIDPVEGRYVFYTIFEGNVDRVYYYDTEINIDRGTLGQAFEGDITSLTYHNGVLSYTFVGMPTEHENRGIVSRIAILPNFMNKYSIDARDMEFEHTSTAQTANPKGIYSYMPETNTIDYLQIGQNTLPRIRVKDKPTKLISMSVFENKNWAVLEETTDKKHILRTKFGSFEFTNAKDYTFVDAFNILFEEDDKIFILHTNTGEKEELTKEEKEKFKTANIKSSPVDLKKLSSLGYQNSIQNPIFLNVLDDNNWIIIEETKDHTHVLHTKFGSYANFIQLNGAHVLDADNLLISENGVLYIWDIKNNKKEIVSSGVGGFKVNKSSIYFTGFESKIFEMKYEKK